MFCERQSGVGLHILETAEPGRSVFYHVSKRDHNLGHAASSRGAPRMTSTQGRLYPRSSLRNTHQVKDLTRHLTKATDVIQRLDRGT